MPKHIILLLLLLSALFSCQPNLDRDEDNRPNFLLIVADDLGYIDIGPYGGEISTPNLDGLAKNGIKFSNFHTAPTCAPTRAMLFSGNDNHIAGMGSQFKKTGEWGYEGHLTDRIVTFPQLLKDNGYHTYIAGKWHLGSASEHNPDVKGFENSYTMLYGAANHYDDQSLFPEDPKSIYTENGKEVEWPQGKYSTKVYTDKLLHFIDSKKDDGQPFLAVATYTSPHWPLQVDSAYWKKYKGQFSKGYEELRISRFKTMQTMGLIAESATLPEIHSSVKPWDSLTPNEKKIEERKMELYAGMVDNLDYHIGRILDYLKKIKEIDNTVIVFMSDNGAAPRDFFYHPEFSDFLKEYFNNDYDNMGSPTSYVSYGPQWAEAGTAGFRYYKDYTTEGGIRTPMIIQGPGILPQKDFSNEFISLLDIAPTFLEMAGAEYPDEYNRKKVYPLKGESIAGYAPGQVQEIHNEDYVFAVEQAGNAVIFKDHWKLVSMSSSDTSDFQLFNTSLAINEQEDLSHQFPDKRKELMSHWLQYRDEVKVIEVEPEMLLED